MFMFWKVEKSSFKLTLFHLNPVIEKLLSHKEGKLEYNSNFGSDRSITVPYDPFFSCTDAHYSGQYFGASILALESLANKKGYYFIGCNSSGNNAYFLKNQFINVISPNKVQNSFVSAKFRDERDENQNLLFSSRESSINSIRGMPVFNVSTGRIEDFWN